MTNQPSSNPPQHVEKGDQDNDFSSVMDPESYAYWRRACAALPPMSPEEIATVAVVLRRIDDRRGHPPQ